jgi:Mlc titration factor MtfA (ptsG expression regulator)
VTRAEWVLLVGCVALLTPLWLWPLRALLAGLRRRAPEPFPAAWRMQLVRDCQLYRRLPRAQRGQLELLVREFLAQQRFVACGGLLLDAGMTRLIATQACLLVMARGVGAYRGLGAILVYPDEFLVPHEEVDEAGVVHTHHEPLSGQSLAASSIVLSWADVLAGARAGGGYNVVVHEFAHFLDHQADGALSSPGDAARRALLAAELGALRASVDRGEDTLIDPYATTDEAEFFAVASEHFFCEPQALCAAHPALHALLCSCYGVDPGGWHATAT